MRRDVQRVAYKRGVSLLSEERYVMVLEPAE